MKKLENEYRQLMQNETPDLWRRIEAGIDAKIVADTEKNFSKKAKSGANLWKKYSLPLVACIAAIICVPLLLTGFIRMASGGKANTTEMAADCAAADYGELEETTSATMDTAAVVTEESWEEEFDDALAETESAPEEIAETTLDEAVTEVTAEDGKQNTEKLEDLAQMLTVTVTQIVQGTEVSGENGEQGTVYCLTTEEVGECTMLVPADAVFEYDTEIQLKIQVEPGNEEYDFVFMNIIE